MYEQRNIACLEFIVSNFGMKFTTSYADMCATLEGTRKVEPIDERSGDEIMESIVNQFKNGGDSS